MGTLICGGLSICGDSVFVRTDTLWGLLFVGTWYLWGNSYLLGRIPCGDSYLWGLLFIGRCTLCGLLFVGTRRPTLWGTLIYRDAYLVGTLTLWGNAYLVGTRICWDMYLVGTRAIMLSLRCTFLNQIAIEEGTL